MRYVIRKLIPGSAVDERFKVVMHRHIYVDDEAPNAMHHHENGDLENEKYVYDFVDALEDDDDDVIMVDDYGSNSNVVLYQI